MERPKKAKYHLPELIVNGIIRSTAQLRTLLLLFRFVRYKVLPFREFINDLKILQREMKNYGKKKYSSTVEQLITRFPITWELCLDARRGSQNIIRQWNGKR
uniref:Uncharacterized protein n=1 Tax=Glossina pallidipes TaxID=7398 RepID=A0A1A9ZBN1_GLOPL